MSSFDDQPVGQHQGFEIPELPPEESKEKEIPLRERLLRKDSRIRFTASCELVEEIKIKVENSELSNSELEEYQSTLQKLLEDSHPGIQEKSLDCLQVFLRKNIAITSVSEIVHIIIEKNLTVAKPSIKSKAIEVLMIISESNNAVYATAKSLIDSKTTLPK